MHLLLQWHWHRQPVLGCLLLYYSILNGINLRFHVGLASLIYKVEPSDVLCARRNSCRCCRRNESSQPWARFLGAQAVNCISLDCFVLLIPTLASHARDQTRHDTGNR